MFEFADTFFQQRRRLVLNAAAVTVCLLLVCLLGPILQTYHGSVETRVRSSYGSQTSQSIGTDAVTQFASDSQRVLNKVEVDILSGIMSMAMGISHFDMVIVHGAQTATSFTLHGIATGVIGTLHATGSVFAFMGSSIGHGYRGFQSVTHLSSFIQPRDNTPTPIITQLRANQASLIQSGTKDVSIAALTTGIGGACDVGAGNGGYPLSWCNAPIDSIATVSYTSDRINRECTSYAYWYFTTIEGHTDFRVTGNAKSWAYTSSYPVHLAPAVGAIAVETAGAYGHVAVIQALPGQTYAGQVVPAGYALVSEMNYDWSGHFRYSFSPLSKFTSYIYP